MFKYCSDQNEIYLETVLDVHLIFKDTSTKLPAAQPEISNLPDRKHFPNPSLSGISTSSTTHECMKRDYFRMEINAVFGPDNGKYFNQGCVIYQNTIQACVMYQFTIHKNRMDRRVFDRGKCDNNFSYL